MKHEIITQTSLTRHSGYLYFLDKAGDIGRRKRNPGHHDSRSYDFPNETVIKLGVKKEPGYLYFLKPKEGGVYVMRAPMKRRS